MFTTPLPAEATWTDQDLVEIIKESEALTQERMTVNTEMLSNKIDGQSNMYFLGLIVSAGISVSSTFYTSKSLENTMAKFVDEKDTIKELPVEVNIREQAMEGTIVGVVVTLLLMASGAAIVYAVTYYPQ